MTTLANPNAYVFDARGISKRFRHAAIFGALEALDDGETMRFVNDHDPLPLLHQIQSRYAGQVRIEYVERGPERIVIDFAIAVSEPANASVTEEAGCGSAGGGGCGCSG
jgi:uncharacterized protein (DUF2249 family)